MVFENEIKAVYTGYTTRTSQKGMLYSYINVLDNTGNTIGLYYNGDAGQLQLNPLKEYTFRLQFKISKYNTVEVIGVA